MTTRMQTVTSDVTKSRNIKNDKIGERDTKGKKI